MSVGKSALQALLKNKVLLALVIVCAILSLTTERFLDIENIKNIFLQSAIMGVVAIGMTYVIITAGIDLGVGSVLGLSSVIVAGLVSNGFPLVIVLLAGVVIGALSGGINGFFITKFKMAPFIVTLGMMAAARSVALVYTDAQTISIYDNAFFKFLRTGEVIGIPIMIIIPIIVFIIGHYVLQYTLFGRQVYAIGNNKKAAELSGINVKRIEMMVYIIAGLLSGIAGILMTARLGSGSPLAGTNLELMAIAAVVIGGSSLMGGRGTIFGTVIGVLLINVINTGMNLMNISAHYQGLIMGAVILLAALIDSYGNKK
ncbi:ribose ABC transporter permease [Bacillus taeanensis]|uniref:Ribose ABC transporter permease n=2 Tax=Bacillus taeanensis TaxID=273032 RepID=A0A366XSY9_9BACI|nr:ribose ABC transporter permease [Bacillus taeanensis]